MLEKMNLKCDYFFYLSQRYLKEYQKFLNANPSSHPDLLCFHGHTIKHKPERGITHQLGTWQAWADAFHIPLVGDFRSPDVDLQGQGAPLVPGGDIHLFQEFDYTLNLGGFANVTDMTTIAPKAYDICAVNTVLNRLIAPPLPAASLPSKMIASLNFFSAIHFCRFTNSACNFLNSASYFILSSVLAIGMLCSFAMAINSFLVCATSKWSDLNFMTLCL